MQKLRYLFTGYLFITVRGYNTEKLINLAIANKIPLWDIKKRAGQATMKVDLDSFYDLRHLARRTGCRLHILRKTGFPFLCHRFMKRRGMLIGMCIFIVGLYLLSSFILFVGVKGNDMLGEGYIRELAARSGAYRGILKSRLDKDDVANKMLIAEPKLEWVGIHIRGTRLIIEVAEAKKPDIDIDRPANLIAAKDGLVTSVLVVMGEAKVKPGDTVRRGQLLIEGVLRPQPQYQPEEGSGPLPVPVHARGEVTARVWYEGYGEAALTEISRVQTGRKVSVWTLFVDGQAVLRVGRSNIAYADYDTVTSSKNFSERIIQFPVEIITETYYEVDLQERKMTKDQALALATDRAKTLAQLQLPDGIQIESELLKEIMTDDQGFVGVRYVLETHESIAEVELLDGGEEPN